MKTSRTSGLRRKARRLHRQADLAFASRRTFDAAVLRDRARRLEARADHEDAVDTVHACDDLKAGFVDDDIPTISTVREAEDFYGLVLR